MSRKGSSVIRNTVLLIASVFVALLLGEGALRMIGYSNASFYTVDSDLGAAPRPGAEGWWTREGRAYVTINSDGLTDIEHSIDKPPDTIRAAMLGDSYAEGLQLPIDKLFWKFLERQLNHCLIDAKVEVLNFAVSGYGTGSELLMLRKKVWKYQPNIVILAFLTGNDIRDNSKTLNGIEYVRYFDLQNGELVLDRAYKQTRAFKIREGWAAGLVDRYINHIRLLQLANDFRQKWRARQHLRHRGGDQQQPGTELGLDNAIYHPPRTDEWNKAWQVTEALILQINKEVNARGARFLLVSLSNGMQVHPDPEKRRQFMEKLGIEDLFYPDRRIIDFAKLNDIDALMGGETQHLRARFSKRRPLWWTLE